MSDGLVLYLPLDEGRGTIVYDKSGQNNNGTVHGASWTDAKYGKGLSLDGYDDYVEVYPFEGTFSAFTIAFWMKTSDNTKDGTPISMSDGTQHNEILLFNYRNFQLYIEGTAITTNVSANDGQWHFIVWTWQSSDGATKLYKDGTLAFSGTLRQGGAPDPKNLILGQEQDTFGGGFDPRQAFLGIIDEVRMYNRVLSADEIKQLYLLGPRSCSANYFVLRNGIDITDATESFKVSCEQGKKTVCTLDLVLEDVTVQEGDHIEIYATHSDTFPKIFDGYVKRYSKKDRAGEKILSVECDDIVGKFEERSITKRYLNQTATSILLDILDPLVKEGLIATDYVENCTLTLDFTVTNKTILDAINELAFRVGWSWYVDPVQQFHFFETGPYLGTITVTDLDTYTYRKDKSELVNRVTVLGAKYCYPDSQDLCESLEGWTASGTLSLKDKSFSLPPQAGKYSVCSEACAVNANYLEYTFSSPLDLSKPWSFKTLNISIGNKLSNLQITEVSIYLFTDSNNYFSSGNLISAFDERGGSWVNLSLEVGPNSSWDKTGNPSWSSITKLRVQVIYSGYPTYVALLVDKLFFAEGRRHGFAEDTDSQATYGLCEMPTVVKDSIKTDEECQRLAEAIIAENSQPKDILEDIVVSDLREDFALGSRLTIEVPEVTLTSKIVSFVHHLEDGDTYTEVAIANVSKTASEVVREHEARLREQEGEKLEPSIVITAPSSTPVTPEQVLDSPPGPPSAPTGLTWESRPAAILVGWHPNPEADVVEYELWRGTVSTSLNTLVKINSTSYLDYDVNYDTPYYYALKAIDRVGNKSPFSNTIGPIYAQRFNIEEIQDVIPGPCTITVEGEKIDSATTFRAWIKVTIQRQPLAGGYIVAYRRTDQTYFTEMWVEQPSSGNTITAITPDLDIPGASSTFVVKAATVSQKGTRSEWTPNYYVTLANTVPPSAPSTISCSPGLNVLFLECSEVNATDFSHYEWYAGTISPPANTIGTSTARFFVWKPDNYDYSYYVGVRAVDRAGNKSGMTVSSQAFAPLRVRPVDLSIESRPWAADAKITVDDGFGIVRYSGSDGTSNLTLKFADGSTITLPKGAKPLSSGLNYLYWEGNEVKLTTNYSAAVGENKGLLACIDAPVASNVWYFANRSSDVSGYYDFSPTNTTTATSFAASKSFGLFPFVGVRIRKYNNGNPVEVTNWVDVEVDTLREYQVVVSNIPPTFFDRVIIDVRAGVDDVTTVRSFITQPINAELSGTWTFRIWAEAREIGDLLRCIVYHGSSSYNSRCTNFPVPVLAKPATVAPFSSYMPTIGAGVIAAKAVRAEHLVTDQAIITQAAQIGQNVIISDHVTSIESDKIHLGGTIYLSNWRHGSDVTKIDGGQIYTESITAAQIAAKSITTDKLTVGRSENLVVDGNFELGDLSKEWVYTNAVLTSGYTGNYAVKIPAGENCHTKSLIAVKPGDKIRCMAYAKVDTGGTARLEVFGHSDPPGSPVWSYVVGETASTSWTLIDSGTIDITIPDNVRYIRPVLFAVSNYAYFDEVAIYRKVDNVEIAEGGVTTRHVRFTPYNSLDQVPKEEGLVAWVKTPSGDIDKIVFCGGTTLDKVSVIPKYPLYEIQAPPENYLPNQSFEIDRDDDGTPDFWTPVTFSGSPRFGRAPDSYYPNVTGVRGKYAAYIYISPATGEGKYRSVFIPITPGKKYFISAYVRGSIGKTHEYSVLHLEVFDHNKSYDWNKFAEIDPADQSWKQTSTSWTLKTWEVFIPESMTAKDGQTTIYPRYIRIALRNYSSSSSYETVFWDDIVFSEMRAAVGTAQWAEAFDTGWKGLTIPAHGWNYDCATIPVADYDRLVVYTVAAILDQNEGDTIFYCVMQARAVEGAWLRNVGGIACSEWWYKGPQPDPLTVPMQAQAINGAFHLAAGVGGYLFINFLSFDPYDVKVWIRVYGYIEKPHYHR